MELLFLFLPWVAVLIYLTLVVRIPEAIPSRNEGWRGSGPFVSIIVPARNEEENIEACLSSLCASEYPRFEVLVVDDRSLDRTPEVVEGVSPGNARRLTLIRGKPVPDGWFGKPWACFQGAESARGDLLLFTDADTIHHPLLLSQTVGGLIEEDADVYTVIGRQVMGSFWEKLLQPQFFLLLAARYPGVGTPKAPRQWRHAIANGQYLLFKRPVYEVAGGHEVVAGEVVEDLRLAQHLVRGGWKLVVRGADGLRTRMYRSLGGLVDGWSKNVGTAALQTTPGWLLPVIMPLSVVTGATVWLLPPVVLLWALLAGVGGTALLWAVGSTGVCVIIWCRASALMGGSGLFGFLYPLGSLLSLYIFLRSWWRGTEIQWKGRSYRMPDERRRQPPGRMGP